MQAVLLAAGLGTRLRPYSTLRPKPLFPVLNQPLLQRLLQKLRDCGVTRIVVNAHHLADQIEAALAPWPEAQLQYEREILGTGGSLRRALTSLANEPVLVVNGDVYHDIPLRALYAHHLASGNAVTLAMHDMPRFNTVHTEGDRVLGFDHGATGLAFTGLQVLDPQVIARVPEDGFFHSIDLYRQLAPTGSIGLMRVDDFFWHDMGTPADYLLLHQILLQRHTGWLLAPTARIAADVRLRGWGCVGDGAVLAAGVQLEDCVVWDGARVAAGTSLRRRILTGHPALDSQPEPGVETPC